MIEKRLADYLKRFKSYSQSYEYYDQYKSQHRMHQIEALEAINKSNLGQILSPCGTGKTRIQISCHVENMIEKSKNSECGVYLIASHRLALNVQLFDQFIDLCVKCGLSFNVLFVGSYNCDFSKYYAEYSNKGFSRSTCESLSTTNKSCIEVFVAESKKQNRHVIIVSTYHSFDTLKDIGKINVCTYDEAHNTIEKDFNYNINLVKPNIEKEYFFTATRKVRGEDDGMNDKSFYGEVLFDAFPHLMLLNGEIACPKIHVIDLKDPSYQQESNVVDVGMLVKNTIEAFEYHRKYIKEESANPDKISPMMLVSCSGIDEMMRIYNHQSFKDYVNSKNIKSLAISSDGCFYDYEQCNKQKFISNLNSLKTPEEAIIFNVDMLTEGIDLPSITGVMPMRNLGLVKLIQLIGRALRLYIEDRKNLYQGVFAPCKFENYIKPYGYLIVPRHLAQLDKYKMMIEMVKKVINEYETPADQIVIQERFVKVKVDELDSIIKLDLNSKKDYDLEHDQFDIISDITIDQFVKDVYSKQIPLQYLKEMIKKHEQVKNNQ